MPSSDRLRAVVQRYVDLLAQGTAADIAGLYAEHATVEDPVGGEPKVGRAAIREFYERATAMDNTTELLAVRVAGNEAAAHFRVVSVSGDTTYRSAPIDTFVFDDARIVTMRAYWGPEDFEVS